MSKPTLSAFSFIYVEWHAAVTNTVTNTTNTCKKATRRTHALTHWSKLKKLLISIPFLPKKITQTHVNERTILHTCKKKRKQLSSRRLSLHSKPGQQVTQTKQKKKIMITLGIQLTKQNKHLIRKQRKTNYRKKNCYPINNLWLSQHRKASK